MEKRNKIILVASLTVIFLGTAVASFYLISTEDNFLNESNLSSNSGNLSYPHLNISDNSKNISNTPIISEKILGSTDYGKVTVEGPFGNSNSPVKIAVIVGVHPLESNSHRAAVESIKSRQKSLNYCYYIYRVDVTRDAQDYNKGRMKGQLLANKFAVPHIINQKYNLALDIHSNRGNYKEKWFIFAPLEDSQSKSIALKIKGKLSGFVYYNPPSQTSPKYVTIPLINAGTPAIVYETYFYDSYESTGRYAKNFINAVDNIKI